MVSDPSVNLYTHKQYRTATELLFEMITLTSGPIEGRALDHIQLGHSFKDCFEGTHTSWSSQMSQFVHSQAFPHHISTRDPQPLCLTHGRVPHPLAQGGSCMAKRGAQKGMQKHMVLASFRNIKGKGIGTLDGGSCS